MVCYIYKIINTVTGEKYVGQTTNFSRRKSEHFSKLMRNCHPNPKLQASWNKYGKESFIIEKKQYKLTKQELDLLEISEIKKENSYNNGFNLTEGGTGGDTRSKLLFHDFCEIYFGNTKYPGLTNRTGHIYNCDSSTVSTIKNLKGYDKFRQLADGLPEAEKNKYLTSFEEKLQLDTNPPKPNKPRLTENEIIEFLSILSCYKRGAEAAFIREKSLSKGLGYHLQRGEYKKEQQQFSKLTDDEIWEIGTTYFKIHHLQNFCSQEIKQYTQTNKPSWIAH